MTQEKTAKRAKINPPTDKLAGTTKTNQKVESLVGCDFVLTIRG